MDRKEFNSDKFNKNQAIQEDYSNIMNDESFDRELYDIAISAFFNSNDFEMLSKEQKEELKYFFEELKKSMDSPKIPQKFKLPERFYLEVISSSLYEFKHLSKDNIDRDFFEKIKYCRNKLNYIIKNDNKFDEKIGNLLWNIYKREDLAIGVHGTTLKDNFDISVENCDFFKHGIMVNERYKNGDARRTVNFQDLPGKQYAFGYISFLGLMKYEYSSRNNNQNNNGTMANFSCIVVRPTNMRDTAYDSGCPQKYSMVTPYTSIRTNDGYNLFGHLIRPEFILGVFKNNEQFVLNPKCDLDNLSQLNECIGKRNDEIAKKKEEERAKVEKLGKETSDIRGADKKKIVDLFKKIINSAKSKDKTAGKYGGKENDSK